MKEDWEKAIEFVLKMEGGSIAENDPHDPGGLTKYGISKKAYPNLDIEKLTLDEAKWIYKRDYWDMCKCDELPCGFAIATFDCAVNQGVTKAKRLLQISLGVTVDGIIGEKTIAAAQKAEPWRIRLLLAERLASYARLMAEKQNLLHYALNWSKRVLCLSQVVLSRDMA